MRGKAGRQSSRTCHTCCCCCCLRPCVSLHLVTHGKDGGIICTTEQGSSMAHRSKRRRTKSAALRSGSGPPPMPSPKACQHVHLKGTVGPQPPGRTPGDVCVSDSHKTGHTAARTMIPPSTNYLCNRQMRTLTIRKAYQQELRRNGPDTKRQLQLKIRHGSTDGERHSHSNTSRSLAYLTCLGWKPTG